MARYECTNCGEGGGIAYGTCRQCTPERLWNVLNSRECRYPVRLVKLAHSRIRRAYKTRYIIRADGTVEPKYQLPDWYSEEVK